MRSSSACKGHPLSAADRIASEIYTLVSGKQLECAEWSLLAAAGVAVAAPAAVQDSTSLFITTTTTTTTITATVSGTWDATLPAKTASQKQAAAQCLLQRHRACQKATS
jgi:hypothetical protein